MGKTAFKRSMANAKTFVHHSVSLTSILVVGGILRYFIMIWGMLHTITSQETRNLCMLRLFYLLTSHQPVESTYQERKKRKAFWRNFRETHSWLEYRHDFSVWHYCTDFCPLCLLCVPYLTQRGWQRYCLVACGVKRKVHLQSAVILGVVLAARRVQREQKRALEQETDFISNFYGNAQWLTNCTAP